MLFFLLETSGRLLELEEALIGLGLAAAGYGARALQRHIQKKRRTPAEDRRRHRRRSEDARRK